ncbi:hypothetical protein GpartN1_g703.t1 [Galdieria partita]|uniref:Aminotransferase class I/classII large domain-containing protein n=1 Tax=Galdieria partita TaxID=83374 RepID=A0A9C7PRZ9_9RHOD|nr:hypothetical protein GpartN1_g703.t1 [Galdieria partita]
MRRVIGKCFVGEQRRPTSQRLLVSLLQKMNFHTLPKRVQQFQEPSVWLEFSPLSSLCNAINLGQGFPDWKPPPFVLEAASKASSDPHFSQYARSSGLQSLVSTISRTYAPLLQRSIDPTKEVCVTVGASEAIFLACQAFVESGDEVIFIEPAFDIYFGAVVYAGATPRWVPLHMQPKEGQPLSASDLRLDYDELRSVLSERSRLLILNTPHNPTGKVFKKEELQAIAKVLQDFPRCLVLCDEVYQHLVYDDEVHVPMATIDNMWERTISVYSAGKTFSVTGWKIGWAIGPWHLIRPMMLSQQWIVFSTTTPLQQAVASSLEQATQPFESEPTYYAWLKKRYQRKRDYFYQALIEAGLHPVKPQGSFFIMIDISEIQDIRNEMPPAIMEWWKRGLLDVDQRTQTAVDYNFCRWQAVEKGVTAIPFSAFYSRHHQPLGSRYVRFSFCKEDAVLEEAKQRLVPHHP